MVALPEAGRKATRFFLAGLAALFLAACDVAGPAGNLGQIINPNRPVQVALLVPRSNPADASRAASLENAARLAVADHQGPAIALSVYDTAGNDASAAEAARRAISEGAEIIVGPFYSSTTAAVGQVASAANVNVLSFSNNPDVAGGNVFILGNTFGTAADRLTRYAARQGRGNIYIVHAQALPEEIGRDAIRRAISANGAQLAGVGSFPLSQQGVINAIPQLSSEIRASGATSVFLTSGTDGAIPFLAELLPENGIERPEIQTIGLRPLDRPASALSLRGIQGAWFATPSPAREALFAQRYSSAYGSRPNDLAFLAYDGIAAVGALLATGEGDALTTGRLTQGRGFSGALGPFRLFPNGTNERALAVAEVQNNQVIVIDPAPQSFGAAGF